MVWSECYCTILLHVVGYILFVFDPHTPYPLPLTIEGVGRSGSFFKCSSPFGVSVYKIDMTKYY